MKKSVIIAIGIVAIASLLGVSLLFINANNTVDADLKSIEEDHARICAEIEEGLFNSAGRGAVEREYAPIFRRIADGDRKYAKKYAQLLLEIAPGSTMDINANEVFDIAADYAWMYEQMAEGTDDFGVQHVKIIEDTSGKKSLVIDYIDIGGCSVRMMDESDKVVSRGRLVEDDGSLGKHRIEIKFGDARASAALSKEFPNQTDKLKEVPDDLKSKINIRMACPDDSMFIIYIGSDEPISIEEQGFTNNHPKGSIEIALEK